MPGLVLLAAGNTPSQGERARRGLAAIRNRQLQRAWVRDPTLPGTTIDLSPADAHRVDKWLRRHVGVDASAYRLPRFASFATWAAVMALAGRWTDERARKRACWAWETERRWLAANTP